MRKRLKSARLNGNYPFRPANFVELTEVARGGARGGARGVATPVTYPGSG